MRIIYYDLETTGLKPREGPNGVQIVQIGATSRYRGRKTTFGAYLVPSIKVTEPAVSIHGLTNKELHDKLRKGQAHGIKKGLKLFVDWIDDIIADDHENNVVLVSYQISISNGGNSFLFFRWHTTTWDLISKSSGTTWRNSAPICQMQPSTCLTHLNL